MSATLRARRPSTFISYCDVDGYHIGRLADAFRKAQIDATTMNADKADPRGALLVDYVRNNSSPSKILLLAVSQDALKSEWFTSTFPDKIYPKIQPSIDRTIVLDLGARQGQLRLPPYLRVFERVDLRDYAVGVADLISRVGASLSDLPETRRGDEAEYYTVSGAFEVRRTSLQMFDELKRQLYYPPFKPDLKYLYWDVRAAARWKDITEMSRYLTTQTAVNVLTRHADELAERILADGSSEVSFVNFGVGTGQKDFLILRALLERAPAESGAKVAYFPVDESLPMIQITIAALEDLMAGYADSLAIRFVLDDFQFIDRFGRYVRREEESIFDQRPPRLLAFMDTLGNFDERHILGLLKGFMEPRDLMLLGVELIGGRPHSDLKANYSDDYMTAFLAGPITDVFGQPDAGLPEMRLSVVESNKDYSVVPRAATVVGRLTHRGQVIEMFHSTKYEEASLETFLGAQGFTIVERVFSEHDPPRYANYVLAAE